MKKLGILMGAFCLLVIAGLWIWRFQITEKERVQTTDLIYSAGEAVPFGENFFWSNSENPNGYTITVDSAQTRNVREFLEENGSSWEEVYPETEEGLPLSEMVYLITATVKNESNKDGKVQFGNFMMTSGSILLQLDGTLSQGGSPIANPPSDGSGGGSGFHCIWPLPGVSLIYSPFNGYPGHKGMDIAGPWGTPVVAAADGQVIEANNYDSWGYSWGYYVLIYHNGTYSTRYAHLSSVAVSKGQYVTTGTVIGYEGDTGNVTGPHLHFEVYENGTRVDPARFL